MVFGLFFIFILGLVVGSFLGAYTYRWPRHMKVSEGRSRCPHCRKTIAWYDNIPLLSFLLLNGKCRNCGKHISLRYPLIELSTGTIFVLVYYFLTSYCTTSLQGPTFKVFKAPAICTWGNLVGPWALPYFLFFVSILIAIFVIDLENKIIPDELVFLLIASSFLVHIFGTNDKLYTFLLSGFSASIFFIFLNIITMGRGMGLGDAKLVIPLGLMLGWPSTALFLYSSFIIGAVVGIFLVVSGRSKFGKKIPFGPFLVVGFLIALFLPSFRYYFF